MTEIKWTKILTNLLSNAIKYTLQGGQVSVQLTLTCEQARVTITDTGVGIDTKNIPHIFERFYQADDSTTRMHEGSGIGLALVKELTDLLEGKVSVTSQAGQGTSVLLTLPFGPAQPEAKITISDPVSEPKSGNGVPGHQHAFSLPDERESKTLVLVVEDNLELREFICGELSPHYLVLTAGNGSEAWQMVQQELPDIVVSDVMMPLLDGFALTRLIKSDPICNHIAVVLLTARTARESRLEGLTLGADDYLTKPFHSDELGLRLRNLLTRRQKLQAYFRHQHQLSMAGNGAQPAVEEQDSSIENSKAFSQLPNPFLETLYELIEARLDDSTYSVEQLSTDVGMSRSEIDKR